MWFHVRLVELLINYGSSYYAMYHITYIMLKKYRGIQNVMIIVIVIRKAANWKLSFNANDPNNELH